MTSQSVRNYLSGVKLLHVFAGFEFSFYDEPELKLTFRGLDRILKRSPSRAPPFTPALLQDLVKGANHSLSDLMFS